MLTHLLPLDFQVRYTACHKYTLRSFCILQTDLSSPTSYVFGLFTTVVMNTWKKQSDVADKGVVYRMGWGEQPLTLKSVTKHHKGHLSMTCSLALDVIRAIKSRWMKLDVYRSGG